MLDTLLRRRLVFLSGKGGVGKSAVGLALALAACRRGKRVLVVEIEAALDASRLLGAPASEGSVVQVRPGLSTLNLDADHVMAEYIRRTIRLDVFVKRILASPVYQRFFAAAPGLPELMMLGKIMDLEKEGGRKRRYDLILVDAPATGHGLAFLKVPQAASAAIPVGPVGANARRIHALLKDHRRTSLVVVAVPEEMAAVEALQLHRLATQEIGIRVSGVILNACHERRFTRDQEAEILRLSAAHATGRLDHGVSLPLALAVARSHIRRHKMTQFYVRRLRRELGEPPLTLPYLFSRALGETALDLLADRLESA
jgi:anion-transporting  ArsA/GET3 family ATPase